MPISRAAFARMTVAPDIDPWEAIELNPGPGGTVLPITEEDWRDLLLMLGEWRARQGGLHV